MRKILAILTLAVSIILTGCSTAATAADSPDYDDGDMLVISERFFASRVNDILMNPQQYIGRTIQYEGMFASFPDILNGGYFHIVYRYTEGCCGPFEPLGFGLTLNGIEPLPNDSWVQVVGEVQAIEHAEFTVIRIYVDTLTEMDERGEEFVSGWGFQEGVR